MRRYAEQITRLAFTLTRPLLVALFDGTQLVAQNTSEKWFVLEAVGIPETIIEVGELFAWMTGALRSAPGDGIAYVIPYLAVGSGGNARGKDSEKQPNQDILCEVKFVPRKWASRSPSSGKCWQNLFRSPVVVLGFPVRRRSQREPGLEVSLANMASLVRTRRVSLFRGKVFLKGFCTMLVPTKRAGDMVIWHVLFNESGEHIAYSDKRVRELASNFEENLRPSDLDTARHIVGWCTNVEHRAGENDRDKQSTSLALTIVL
jgi:hypothetical protein